MKQMPPESRGSLDEESRSGVSLLAQELPTVSRRVLERAWPGIDAHLAELAVWAPRLNLVGPGSSHEWLIRHVLDSLHGLECIADHNPSPAGSRVLVDIGSGAGFPGLPLAFALADIETHLWEPRRRRAHFLRAVIRRAGAPSIQVEETRAEDVERAAFADIVASRAVFGKPSDFLHHAERLLKPGGQALLFCAGAAPATDPADTGLAEAPDRTYQLPGSPRRYRIRSWAKREA